MKAVGGRPEAPLAPRQRTSPRPLQKIPLGTRQRMMAPANARRVGLSKAPVQILVPLMMAAPNCFRSGKGKELQSNFSAFGPQSPTPVPGLGEWVVQGGWFFPSGFPSFRSVIVENSSGQNNSCTSASELLKPMKKRKHRDYQSPSEEESEPEAMVGRGVGREGGG